MKIKGTESSYCKVLDTKISGFKAYIKLLITSITAQKNPCAFCFYIYDYNTKETLQLSNNNYWIDRCTNYDNDNTNVDINMYKEILLEVDISNLNKSEMQDCRWYRKFNILLLNTKTLEECWSSGPLEVVSKEIILPNISEFSLSRKGNDLYAKYTLGYHAQEDFNYINNNIKLTLIVRSIYTDIELFKDEILSSALLKDYTSKTNEIKLPDYTEPIQLELHIRNLKDDTLQKFTKFYNPEILNDIITMKTATGITSSHSIYIKTSEGIKRISKIN